MKKRLNKLLDEAGMSQAESARKAKIRPVTVCYMYNNNCVFIKLEYVERICKVLDCKIG
jgi:DNA-binding Xre family transcriptional regulator